MNPKLKLVSSEALYGTVAGLSKLHVDGRDVLILAFEEAKGSVLAYQNETRSWQTLSMHYYERPELKVSTTSFLSRGPPLNVLPLD